MSTLPTRALRSAACFLALALSLPATQGANITWVGNTSNNWNAANWSGVNNPPISGDALFFGVAGSSGTSLTNGYASGMSFSGITFNSGASAYTFASNWTRLTGDITNNSNVTQTLNLGHELSSSVQFNAAAGNLVFGVNNTINLNGNTLTVAGDFNTTINLQVSGGGVNSKMVKNGNGTLTFGNTTSFQGGMTINQGTVNARTFANLASNAIVVNSGKLVFTVHDAFGNDATNVLAPLTINAGGLVESANTYTSLGPLTLNGGSLVDNGGANGTYRAFKLPTTVTVGGSSASSITSTGGSNKGVHLKNTTFDVANATSGVDLFVSAALLNLPGGGAATLTKDGIGTMELSGANAYSGVTTINAGTLRITNNSGLGTIAGGTDVNAGGTLELASVAVGAEALTLEGTGAASTGALLVDGNTSSYAGAITLQSNATIGVRNGGTLTLTGGVNKAGFNITFLGNGAATNTANVNSVGISGVADLIVDNMTVNLNTANSYVGPTIVQNGGILNANVASALPTGTFSATSIDGTSLLNLNGGVAQTVASLSGAGTVNNTAAGANTLTISPSAGSTNFSGAITNTAGVLSVVKNGAGTQQLSGANTYSGSTTVNAGTLELLSGGSLQNATMNVAGGTLQQTNGVNNITQSGTGTHLTVASGATYSLNGGTLNFGDTDSSTQQLGVGSGNGASTLEISGAFNFTSGTLENVTNIVVLAPGNTFTQAGGTLVVGANGVDPNNPNTTRAVTNISGDFTQTAGTIAIDIFGAEGVYADGEVGNFPVVIQTDSDLLNVTGDLSLDGTLAINTNGIQPPAFGWYDVAFADTITIGNNFQLSGLGLYQVIDNPNGSGQILQVAAPEPTALLMWGLVGLGIYGGWRRRMFSLAACRRNQIKN